MIVVVSIACIIRGFELFCSAKQYQISMKTPLTLSFLIATTFFFYSCTKNANSNEGTELQSFKLTFKDSLLVFYHSYERDADNKIISIKDSNKASVLIQTLEYGANGKASRINMSQDGGDVTYYFEFEYNPNGTIRKRLTFPAAGAIGADADYNSYAYDGAGHLTIDSLFSRGSGSTCELFAVATFQYTGSNVTEAAYYEVVSGSLELKRRTKFEYDNALNPLKNLENDYSYAGAITDIYGITEVSENNVLKEYTAIGNGPYEVGETYTYQYNSNNYAWKVKQEIITPTKPKFELEYFYQ